MRTTSRAIEKRKEERKKNKNKRKKNKNKNKTAQELGPKPKRPTSKKQRTRL